MPKQKDLKRLVRTRMKKTGESYTTARTQLTRPKKLPVRSPAPSPDLTRLGLMSNEAIRAKTGKSWAEWVRALDAIDAARMPHREIALHVHRAYALTGWWAQTVTVGYERIRGLRDVGQRRGGAYECNKSRTFPATARTLYRAFTNPKARARWLGNATFTIRAKVPDRSVRIIWTDETRVQVWFTPKGEKKCQVSIQHTKLASRDAASRLKAWWHERLDTLTTVLTT